MAARERGTWPGEFERAAKEARVRSDRAHAALVFDDEGIAQGWCQYGSPEELPNIKHGREYNKDAPPRPDWRITCFYVDKKHRGQGIARTALEGALNQIAEARGGRVEAIPEVTAGREAHGRFLLDSGQANRSCVSDRCTRRGDNGPGTGAGGHPVRTASHSILCLTRWRLPTEQSPNKARGI